MRNVQLRSWFGGAVGVGLAALIVAAFASADIAPTAFDDSRTVVEDSGANVVGVRSNDRNPDGGPFVVKTVSDPAHGTAAIINGGARVSYTPDPNYCKPAAVDDTFTYKLNGGSTATVSIAITCVDDAPVADDDTFNGADSAIPNTPLAVGMIRAQPVKKLSCSTPARCTVLTGDTDVDTPKADLTVGPTGPKAITSADGGKVTLQADGNFTYFPKAGTSCTDHSDSFAYTLSDNDSAHPKTDTGTVNLATTTNCVWYVDNSRATNGDGSGDSPFNSLGGVNGSAGLGDSDGSGDRLFILNAGSYTGGLPMENGQLLSSKRHGLTIGGKAIVTPGGASNPTISSSSGNALTLANSNTIQGIDLGNAAAASLAGASFTGTATVNTATSGAINNSTGKALDISTGAINMAFTGVSSAGSGTDGIRLDNAAGAFSAAGGSIQNATGQDVDISGDNSGDTVNFTYGGSISDDLGPLVNVSNQSGGTKDFNGQITDGNDGDGAGVTLSSNTGATVRFDGGLMLATGANPAFVATGGGTVAVTDPNAVGAAPDNTIATTAATALNIANTTIGSSDLNFRSISSNGAANGIVLDTTGSSGGLTVTGNGGTCTSSANCSGGALQSSTGAGIVLTNVGGGVALTRLAVNDGGDDGIRGTNVLGLNLANSVVLNNGNAVGERGIEMTELSGSGGLSATTVSGSGESNVVITNDTSTLSAFNVTGSTISNTNVTTGDDGILVLDTGSAAMTVSVTGSTFVDNKGDHFQAASDASSTGSVNVTFDNNTLTTTAANDPNVVGGGITLNPASANDLSFDVTNNDIQQAFDDAINLNLDPSSTAAGSLVGTISGNTIGTAADADSGSESNNAVTLRAAGAGSAVLAIQNNTIRQWANGFGISVATVEGSADVDATVTGNSLKSPGTFGINGVRIDAGATAGPPADDGTLCAGVTGNDATGSGTIGQTDIRLRQRFATTIRLPGYGGSNSDTTAVNSFVSGTNTGNPTVSSSQNVGGGGGGFVGGSTCATP